MFVQDWIIEIEGDDKTDFALKPWFAVIYHYTEEWYRDHYGPATEGNGTAIASGVVSVRGISVEVKVPLTRTTVETPGETVWMHFPVTIDEGENPEDWLVDPPPLTKLDAPERKKLAKKLAEVGTGLRRIHTNLMGINPSDDTVNGLLMGIQPELESAAANILRRKASGRGAALWSLQMAVERILKAFAQHKTGGFRRTHDLFALYDDVKDHGVSAKRTLLNKIPREPQIIADRYGLGGTPSLTELMHAYDAALAFVSEVSESFGREFSIGGARLLLKKPPWTELPPAIAKTDGPVVLDEASPSAGLQRK